MARIRQHSIYASFGLLLTTAVALSIIYAVSLTEAVDLTPYFGGLPPILAALIVCAAGLAAFYVLYMRLDFSICQLRSFGRGLSFATVLVAPFMIVVTISDLVSPFPADINVALPTALAFYPAIGFIAQIALHIVPFALLIVIGDIFLSALNLNLRLWLSTILASIIEPAFQIMSSTSDGKPLLATVVMAVSLFLFGVVELQLYRRFDYATMFVFRMLYYIYWHLVWGSLRLHWLF